MNTNESQGYLLKLWDTGEGEWQNYGVFVSEEAANAYARQWCEQNGLEYDKYTAYFDLEIVLLYGLIGETS